MSVEYSEDVRLQLVADLKAARNELETRGRTYGRLLRESGQVCAVGAVAVAVNDTSWQSLYLNERDDDTVELKQWPRGTILNPRYSQAVRELARHLPDGERFIEMFNDKHTTTDADVLNLFSKALADLGGLGDE